jgi:hypothetical protein
MLETMISIYARRGRGVRLCDYPRLDEEREFLRSLNIPPSLLSIFIEADDALSVLCDAQSSEFEKERQHVVYTINMIRVWSAQLC